MTVHDSPFTASCLAELMSSLCDVPRDVTGQLASAVSSVKTQLQDAECDETVDAVRSSVDSMLSHVENRLADASDRFDYDQFSQHVLDVAQELAGGESGSTDLSKVERITSSYGDDYSEGGFEDTGFAEESHWDGPQEWDNDAHGETSDPADTEQQIDAILNAVGGLTTGHDAGDDSAEPAMRRSARKAGRPAPPKARKASIDPELQDAYLDDAGQCLSAIEQAVLTSPGHVDAKTSQLLCRELHTLKGASASVGLSELADYLHATEDWLEVAESSGQIDLNGILEVVDAIREQVAEVSSTNQSQSSTGGAGTPKSDDHPKLDLARTVDSGGQGQGETLRIRADQLDRLMDMLAELVMLRNRRDSSVNRLKSVHDEMNQCLTRLRTVINVGPDRHLAHETDDEEALSIDPSLPYTKGVPTTQLNEIANDFRELSGGLKELFEPVAEDNRLISQFTRQFRQELMQLKRLPVSGLFQRLQRAAYDAARVENRQVRLQLLGGHAGLERSVQERIYEPLLHLVRNAVSHGIEDADERAAAGKPAQGTVTLEAFGGSQLLTLEIRDDGRGLNYDRIRQKGLELGLLRLDRPATKNELSQLIFHPGFSTRSEANAVSGRGVGLDVVRATLEKLHARIEVESEAGVGMTIRLMIPLKSVIEHTMVVRCGGQLMSLPMTFVKSACSPGQSPTGEVELPEGVEVIELTDLLGMPTASSDSPGSYLIVASRQKADAPGSRASQDVALAVDEILGTEEVVVRPLPPILKDHPHFTGATLSGDGEVVLLLDSHALFGPGHQNTTTPPASSASAKLKAATGGSDATQKQTRHRVLVVDDSISARRALMKKLRPFPVELEEASDGLAALEKLRRSDYDLVLTDLEMPRLGGIELLAEMQSLPQHEQTRTVVISSRAEAEVQEQVRSLGAQAFISKPVDAQSLITSLISLGFSYFDITS